MRQLPSYNSVRFPHCACDSRKAHGHVILSVAYAGIQLDACTDDGEPESADQQTLTINWPLIVDFRLIRPSQQNNNQGDASQEPMFMFEYQRTPAKTKIVQLCSAYVSGSCSSLQASPSPPTCSSASRACNTNTD